MRSKVVKNSETRLTLDGEVRIETLKKGKIVSTEVLDGKVVLDSLLYVLEKALDSENLMEALKEKSLRDLAKENFVKKTPKPKTNIVGQLDGHFETGTEGVLWAIAEDGVPGYGGLHIIREGDQLRVWEAASGREVLNERINFDWKIGHVSEWRNDELIQKDGTRKMTRYDVGQQQALGYWIHGVQTGYLPDQWAELFFRPHGAPQLRAELTRGKRKSKK